MDPRLKSSRWQKARAAVLADEPVCQCCAHRGKAQPATQVDHITPRADAPDRFFDRLNLWALCRSCHDMKSQLEQQGHRSENRESWAGFIAHHLHRRGR